MITIVCGTNRNGSNSFFLSQYCKQALMQLGSNSEIIDLALLPHDFIFSCLYKPSTPNPIFSDFQNKMVQASKYLFVVPEYNGSFPGVLKGFIDGMPYPATFKNKKVAMIGLSAGMQGGGLAMSHLGDILSYMGAHLLAERPKLAMFDSHSDKTTITNVLYQQLINQQMQSLIDF